MTWLKNHLRDKFLAGALAAVPVVVVVWGALLVEQYTRPLAQQVGLDFPGLGVLLAVVGVYLLGVAVTRFLGRFALRLAERLLQKVPGLSLLYRAWKDVLLVPPDKAGTFHQVMLVPNPAGGAGWEAIAQAFVRDAKGCAPGHGGKARATGVPRRSWLRKSRADWPCCQHVRHTDIRTDCARAPAHVRLPPQTFRRITPKRMANSARQLVASSPG